MPRIRQYNSTESPASPGNQDVYAAQIGQANAKGITGLYQPIATGLSNLGARVTEIETARETSSLAAKIAKAQASLAEAQQNAIDMADPNDPDAMDRFEREVAAPTIEALGEGLQSEAARNMYTRSQAEIAGNLRQKGVAARAHLAGVAAEQNYIVGENALTSSVSKNPTSLSTAMALGEQMIGALDVPNEAKIKLLTTQRQKLANSSVLGLADQGSFEAARASITEHRDAGLIDEGDATTLGNHVTTLERAQDQALKAAEVEKRRQNKQAAEEAANTLTASVVQEDGSITISPTFFKDAVAIGQMPDVDSSLPRAMYSFGRSIVEDQKSGANIVDDPGVYEDFARRMTLPATDPNSLKKAEVYNARASRRLSDKSFSFYLSSVDALQKDPDKADTERNFNDIVGGLKSSITKSTPMLAGNPVQDRNYLYFQQDARRIYDAGNKAGKSIKDITAEIRDSLLPLYAIDRKGAMEALRKGIQGGYQPTKAEQSAAAPRLPNESLEAYAARTGR